MTWNLYGANLSGEPVVTFFVNFTFMYKMQLN